jgi:pyruvate ferredoxin oxidoreductase gamma subunit
MYRIRFHGRGGQGMKTASRILGTAFFLEGFEVQDAPRYGAERRGAPIFAYVRAARETINERGVISRPDLVIVADDTLLAVPTAGVMEGVEERTVLLVNTAEEPSVWRQRLNLSGRIVTLPVETAKDRAELPYVGAVCAGAGARLSGLISGDSLIRAIRAELSSQPPAVISENIERAMAAFEQVAGDEGCVSEGGTQAATGYQVPKWVTLPLNGAAAASPAIFAGATSVQVRTGLWRTLRPVIDLDLCKRCTWVCGSFCPDGVISVNGDGYPLIDYDHCKGCLVCVVQCPPHAIAVIPEQDAEAAEGGAS